MATTNFTNAVTLTDAGWFNDVDALTYEGVFASGITSVVPDATDGATLGTASVMWSDLYLASGGVINFNNGNYTLTHSAGLLTLSNAVTITTGNLTVTGGTVTTGAATALSLATTGGTQLQITNTAAATRYITLTGSNGGNPTIGTSAGNVEIAASVVLPASYNLIIAPTQFFYFDSGGDTSIRESSANTVQLVTGGVTAAQFASTGVTQAWTQKAGVYSNGDTTPTVAGVSFLSISNTGATTITQFDDGVTNQIITLFFNDANTTINRDNCVLSGAVNFVSSANDTLTLLKTPTVWAEIARGVNG